MLFNSFEYVIFLPLVFITYWLILGKHVRLQNLFLFIVSFIFYGWWDWRFLILISITGINDFTLAILIEKTRSISKKKIYLGISIAINLGILFFFKYFNFFVESLIVSFNSINIRLDIHTLNIILPVGISFYTFQSLSYTIDVYRGKMTPSKNPLNFFAFISFFPQLVAGPIERAYHLLPQFEKKRVFTYQNARDGILQILWGLFKKAVIADNCSLIVEHCFKNYETLSSAYLILGIIYFAFQIYCDFSGYSDIAIGSAKLLGFDLMRNFAYPYFSRDVAEFWRRWHISLNTWFRDYLYIPLGGSRGGTWMKVRNTIIIFLVSGFWHGANWTFLIWGALNALFFLPSLLTNKNRVNLDIVANDRKYPTLREVISILGTFLLVCITWVFFRADNVHIAWSYLTGMFNLSTFTLPGWDILLFMPFIILMLSLEWWQRRRLHPLQVESGPKGLQYALFIAIAVITILFGNFGGGSFIYFQF